MVRNNFENFVEDAGPPKLEGNYFISYIPILFSAREAVKAAIPYGGFQSINHHFLFRRLLQENG